MSAAASQPSPQPRPELVAKSPNPLSRQHYRQHLERFCRDFEADGSGMAAISGRTRLVDSICQTLWERDFTGAARSGCAFAALGGFGRGELFPYSDVDLLFLTQDSGGRERVRDAVSATCQTMWDIGLRVSATTRSIDDCCRFDQQNLEFTVSLLDCRFLAGDAILFSRLRGRILPQLIARESDVLLQALLELTNERHRRFGNTIFHLEPNLKDTPGGLRDCHVTQWIGMISALAAEGKPDLEDLRHSCRRSELLEAAAFLSSTRCYLHFRHNRDDNSLTWAAQEELAARGVGTGSGTVSPAEWMRLYFRHARTVQRSCLQLLNQVSRTRSSLYRSFQHWRSRVSNCDFSVVGGQAYFQQASDARDPQAVLRLLTMIAQHGVALAAETERRLEDAQTCLSESMPQDNVLWQHLREMLKLPYAADALRTMHSLGLLTRALPELEAIDLLVLRDLYHRYTVDEHTFRAIEVLHQLKQRKDEWLCPFAELLSGLEHPELLLLALLLHDTGKGLEGTDHVHSSRQLAGAAAERMRLSGAEHDTVCFLVGHHLELSSTLRRRDIYDPGVVRALADTIGTPERLKMLTIMTLADVAAVNPDALTPWKAQDLWRLYTRTATYFDRSADLAAQDDSELCREAIDKIIVLRAEQRSEVLHFLDGLPQRYLLCHSVEDVARHFAMAEHLASGSVELQLRPVGAQHELTLITNDRPRLFSTVAAILYAWGMDITKALAFGNRGGIVVDSFYFKDRFRTLELNPTECNRLQCSIREIVTGEAALGALLESRLKADHRPMKLTLATRLRYDNECSARSTMLEIATQDRPGLLHTISSCLADEGCSIEVALIDTEGPLAHDVFYITQGGRKLNPERMRAVEWALTTELSDALPSTW